jgi:hypothetical protein
MRRSPRLRLLAIPVSLVIVVAVAAAAFTVAARAEPGLQSVLTPVGGAQGAGHVDVSPTGDDHDDSIFIAQGTAEIHGALPNTTYVVQRAVDFTPGDGVCTIAPRPPAGWISLTTFTTSDAGAGAGHFAHRTSPPGPAGFQFDLILRVVRQNGDGTLDLSQVLMSACMTVTLK